MMRSLFSGVSGLKVHQTKMDVIANNISNVNTVGFKAARATFNEVFSQTLQGATGPSATTGRGGTNAMQIGLGVNLSSIDLRMTNGAAQRTDVDTDLMIQGDGFFIVGDNNGTRFTRAGSISEDKQHNLVGAGGLKLYGWDAIEDTDNPGQNKIQKGKVQPLTLSGDKAYIAPESTSNIKYEGNLNADTDPTYNTTVGFYDSLGNKYTLDVQYNYKGADATNPQKNTWEVKFGDRLIMNDDQKNPIAVTIDQTGVMKLTGVPTGAASYQSAGAGVFLKFTDTGKVDTTAPNISGLSLAIDASTTTGTGSKLPVNAKFADKINVNMSAMTQFDTPPSALPQTLDGNSAGSIIGFSIGTDGKIQGSYTNGQNKLIGQIAVARFQNPAGLEKIGDNLFTTTPNSGDFDGIGSEPTAGGGKLLGGVLEMSNVDLASEFTDMITTQRGFQANSKIITTSDDMIQELVNLKR